MASENAMQQLQKTAEAFGKIDRTRLLRTNIGEESMEKALSPLLTELQAKVEFATRYASFVHDQFVEHVRSHIHSAVEQLNAQAARSNPDYIGNKDAVLNHVRSMIHAIGVHWAPFVAAAVEQRGFLQDEGIKKEYERTVTRMQDETTATLARIKKEADAAIEGAKQLAQQIEDRARKTAAKISVADAQKQFEEAQRPLVWFVVLWAGLSVAAIVVLGVLLNRFLEAKMPDAWTWQVAYVATIKFAALASVGSIAAYCMSLLRAQLHQLLLNMHRRRVTNSIGAFVESAVTPEQRDLILGHMVDSVVNFGNSGLVGKDGVSEGSMPKLTVDNITRSLGAPAKEPTK